MILISGQFIELILKINFSVFHKEGFRNESKRLLLTQAVVAVNNFFVQKPKWFFKKQPYNNGATLPVCFWHFSQSLQHIAAASNVNSQIKNWDQVNKVTDS